MTNEQSNEVQPSPEIQQVNLVARGYKYFESFAQDLIHDDRSFTTTENMELILHGIWKSAVATGGVSEGVGDALDKIFDDLLLAGEDNTESTIIQGSQYIEAYVKSGLSDISDFLRRVANGEYIF